MRITKASVMFFFVIALLSGCTKLNVEPAVSVPETETAQTPLAAECIAPVTFESEQDFVNAVKFGYDTSPDFFSDITYYYRPANLPKNAVMERIDVIYDYVMLVYTTDTNRDPNDFTNVMTFMWWKSFNYGRDQAIPEIYLSDYCEGETVEPEGQENAKFVIDCYDIASDPMDQNSATKRSWHVGYVQDGACFESTIPFADSTKEQLPKILEMEKVNID